MNITRRRMLLRSAGVSGAVALGGLGGFGLQRVLAASVDVPDDVLNPVEVTGDEAVPVVGRLPGAKRMYQLPAGRGEHHVLGRMLLTRIARPAESGGGHELMSFAGMDGAVMPSHRHLGSHVALLVMDGAIDLELDGANWRMMRGDFANIPPGAVHGWTLRSDRAKLTLFTMGNRVGPAFAAMGAALPESSATPVIPASAVPLASSAFAAAAMAGDFQLAPHAAALPEAQRVTNLNVPSTPTPYVLLDGGGERFGGGNTFCARNQNTNGQFLFIMTEGGAGPGIGAHFHARHTEDFYAVDGETLGWANGKAVPIRAGDYFHAPPRHLHGFRMTQPYNRFVGFLTPGVFENFFTRGQPGRNGVGGRGAGQGAAPASGGPPGGAPRGGPSAPPGTPPGVLPSPGGDMFRTLSNSGVGPDGWPLDVHGATKPLPPQDPIWRDSLGNSVAQRTALIQHGYLCAGIRPPETVTSPELEKALRFKPRAEDFV